MSFGGKFDYAKEYAKYKPNQDTKFESYVDATPDLAAAWEEIQSDPTGTQGSYWKQRGATSKAAFGRAHAAEDMALKTGDYHGGAAGRTDYMPGTDAWKTLFPGDDPSTRFEEWLSGSSGNGNGNGDTGGWGPARGGGGPGSANYPIGLVDYEGPSAMSGIPLEFQPWLQPDHIPDSLWNYQAPTLNEWEVDRNWDWAEKDTSDYGEKPVTSATRTTQQHAAEGGEGNVNGGYEPFTQHWDYGADESDEPTTAFTMDDLDAMTMEAMGLFDIGLGQEVMATHGIAQPNP